MGASAQATAGPKVIRAPIPAPLKPRLSRAHNEMQHGRGGDAQLLDQGKMIDGPQVPRSPDARKGVVPDLNAEPAQTESSKLATAPADAPTKSAEKPAAPQPSKAALSGDAALGAVAREFCSAIADEAAKARTSYQMKKIAELEERLQSRINEFEAKRAELQKAIDKQEELRKKAEDGVIAIISKMKPESAASQLTIMDDAAAAAVLSKLNPRTASTILNEISPAKAARIADAMTNGAAAGAN